MAIGDRSKNIRQNVMGAVRDPSGLGQGQVETVYDSINRVQRRIAEESECLEEKYDITTFPGQELYLLPTDFLRERVLIPTASLVPVKKISMTDVERIKRIHSQTDITGTVTVDVFYYYKWNNQLGLLGSNSAAPSDSTVISLYYWRYPNASNETISNTVDPVVDARWDTALFYGAVADITAEPRWWDLFEKELMRQRMIERTNQAESDSIPVSQDYE